jgi:hypothetical protein
MKRKPTIRHTINQLRAQPLETRRQALVFLSFFCTFILVLMWVFTLKARFQETARVNDSGNAAALIKERVTRVYSDAKVDTKK